MNSVKLLDHFDSISDAPDTIPRLRRFILDLAVRGKLVEQDPDDEGADELLKRVQLEKTRILNGGSIKREKPLAQLTAEEFPFRIPQTWRWSQLAEVGFINPRNDAGDGLHASFVPMTLISADYGVASTHKVRLWGEIKSGYTHFANDDLALAKITPCFENGKSAVFRALTGGIGAGTTELHVLRPVIVNADYILIFLKCPHFIQSGIPRMTGTAGQKRVPTEYFAHSPFPLPPLAEQRRIVAKVDELMGLCDRLAEAQIERESRRDRLAVAALHQLTAGADVDGIARNARFYLDHFSQLTVRTQQIASLRTTILSLAVRGKIVKQRSDEEPASELLRKILAERERLGMTGKIKVQKQVRITPPEHIPFDLPQRWSWACLGQIALGFRYGTSVKCGYESKGEPVLRIPNIKNGRIATEDLKFGPLSKREAEDLRLQLGDILMVRSNGSLDLVGRPALVEADTVGYCYAGYLVRVRTNPTYLSTRYLLLALSTTHTRNQIEVPIRTTVGLKNVNATELSSIAIPLPPLAEQNRIVAKVDELMALCDQLEEQLTAARMERGRLLEAVLHEALRENVDRDPRVQA